MSPLHLLPRQPSRHLPLQLLYTGAWSPQDPRVGGLPSYRTTVRTGQDSEGVDTGNGEDREWRRHKMGGTRNGEDKEWRGQGIERTRNGEDKEWRGQT